MGCPRCGAPVLAEQDWCLVCGAAARTRLAPAPNWRAPLIALAAVIVISLAVLGGAFVALTGDPETGTGATGATGVTAVPAPAPAPAPAPGATGASGTTGANGADDAGAAPDAEPPSGATGPSGDG